MTLSILNKFKNELRKFKYLGDLKLRDIPPYLDNNKINQNSIELFEQGIVVINSEIVEKKITDLKKLSEEIQKLNFNSIKQELINNYKGRKEFKLSLKKYIDEKLIYKILSSELIIDVITEYFNSKPKLNYYDIWLDIPTNNEEKLTQLYHRDYDNKFLVKVFIYLNDVSMNHGPFCYIKTSHKDPWKLYKSKNRLNDIEKNYLYDANFSKAIDGKKNTLIIADTNGMHKGLKPKKERLLLTAMYILDQNS